MKLKAPATRPLWLHLLFCVALAGTGCVAAYWGWLQSETARQDQQQQEQRRLQLQSRLTRLQADGEQWEAAWRRLQALKAQGFFAQENRLAWVELLRQTQSRLALPGLQYEFQPQRPLEQSNDLFMVSTLQLQLSLNHELELMAFLQTLAAQGPALILPRECHLSPNANRPNPPEPGPNLHVSCRLDWITGRLPGPLLP